MHLGILQCGPVPPEVAATYGSYSDMFQRLLGGRGWRFSTWSVMDMAFPENVDAADAWLVTGSRYGVYEDHAFIPPLEDFIRAAWAAKRPMVGICFGHQAIAQALGGTVVKAPSGWNVGRQVYQVDGAGPLALTAWHQDQVIALPAGATVIARNDACPIAGFTMGQTILTLQPHPELGTDVARDYILLRFDYPEYPPGIMSAAERSYDLPLDTGATAAFIADFLTTACATTPATPVTLSTGM
ncbi:type 1 glutamine amidotransferase [Pseudoruegeria sp. SK021]|uniref:type 1 glutamine amidotransferase n=1 Tax=Pseudoruegeria sp. SK021 TaxID=1933035 RepID=UPI000A22FE4B|nr:type 1 glutamine amidotransferase [Pseudoruegeria sp. SK021]OSP54263.1 hypothetical protein BV911_13475 [Pseudoruegeria sp. SK021]